MEAANEAGVGRAFGVKNLDVETSLQTSPDSFSVSKPNQLSDYKSHGYVSNVLVDMPRVNKGGAIRDNGSLSRVVTSRLPVMRRSASSDAILTSYLYGRWPRLDALHTRAVQELRLQPRSSDNSVPDQAASDDISVRTSRALSLYVPATKSASWTECGSRFDDTTIAVILRNNQDYSGNEPVLSSPLEIDELCNQEIDAIVSQTEATTFEKTDQCVNEVDGHRAPLADLLNQLSSSSDCCRAMHFVTIGDSDDSASSDNDMSNENGSVGTEARSDDHSAADDAGASLPADSIPSADSSESVDGFSVRDLSGTSAKHDCRVQCSPCDAVSSSPPTSSAVAEDYSQQFGTGAKHDVIAVKSVCRPAPEGCESKASVLEQQYKVTNIIPSQQSAFVRPLSC